MQTAEHIEKWFRRLLNLGLACLHPCIAHALLRRQAIDFTRTGLVSLSIGVAVYCIALHSSHIRRLLLRDASLAGQARAALMDESDRKHSPGYDK